MAKVDPLHQTFTLAPITGAGELTGRRDGVDILTLPYRASDRYIAGFAVSDSCIEAALRLRFEVFNIELDEGLSQSHETGLDRDRFDDQMTHLVLLDSASGQVVGTYRLQTVRKAIEQGGIYSAEEYDLAPLESRFDRSVEVGRACLAEGHRSFRAMMAMWLGIGGYMNLFDLQYLFGCCSLTTQDPDDGWRALKTIRSANKLHADLFLKANAPYSCGDPAREGESSLGPAIKLPKLFRTYLRLGAEVISEPAIDSAFGTVDFLVMLDGKRVALSRLDVLK